MTKPNENNDLAPLDLRWGIGSLAEFIRRTPRQTYHLVATGKIPAKLLGGRWTWSPAKVRTAMLEDVQ